MDEKVNALNEVGNPSDGGEGSLKQDGKKVYVLDRAKLAERTRDYRLKIWLTETISGKKITCSANSPRVERSEDLENLAYRAINKFFGTWFVIQDKIVEKQDEKFIVRLKIYKPDISVEGVDESRIDAFINAYLEVMNMEGCMKNE